MLTRVLSLGAVLLWTTISSPADADPQKIKADEQSQALGIAVYSIERVGKIVTVETLSNDDLVSGRFELEFDTPKGIAVRFEDSGEALEMFWSPATAELTLFDLASAVSATARPLVSAEGVLSFALSDPQGVFARHREAAHRAFFVLHQSMINLGLYSRGEAKPRSLVPEKSEPSPPPDSPFVSLCPPSCTGPSVTSGVFVNTGGALCCDNANSYLQGRCSNVYCFGCCRTLPCDLACVFGDGFACVCSIRGTACGPPFETSCDSTWPPQCT